MMLICKSFMHEIKWICDCRWLHWNRIAFIVIALVSCWTAMRDMFLHFSTFRNLKFITKKTRHKIQRQMKITSDDNIISSFATHEFDDGKTQFLYENNFVVSVIDKKCSTSARMWGGKCALVSNWIGASILHEQHYSIWFVRLFVFAISSSFWCDRFESILNLIACPTKFSQLIVYADRIGFDRIYTHNMFFRRTSCIHSFILSIIVEEKSRLVMVPWVQRTNNLRRVETKGE